MLNLDYDSAIAILRDIYWVGFEEKETALHCNPYLLIDKEEVVFIDPGSIPDFPIIMRKVIEVVTPESISTIIAGHQDPDVCGNLAIVEDLIDNPELKIVAHSNTGRLIYHYGLKSEMYYSDRNSICLVMPS